MARPIYISYNKNKNREQFVAIKILTQLLYTFYKKIYLPKKNCFH